MPKVRVTEKLREEIRDRIIELTPGYSWHVIARRERESVEQAFLRIDKEGKAEVYSDDAVTAQIYHKSVGWKLIAERDIQWLEKNNLWAGAKFHKTDEPDPEKEGDKE